MDNLSRSPKKAGLGGLTPHALGLLAEETVGGAQARPSDKVSFRKVHDERLDSPPLIQPRETQSLGETMGKGNDRKEPSGRKVTNYSFSPPDSKESRPEAITVSAGVDSLKGNPSKQTSADGKLEEPMRTGAVCRKSDNPLGSGVEQSGVKGIKRPEMKGYGAHSRQRGPRAKRFDMTQSEPALTPTCPLTGIWSHLSEHPECKANVIGGVQSG